MKSLKVYPFKYPYYLLKKIVIPIEKEIKLDDDTLNKEFTIDLLFGDISPSKEINRNIND